jgi:hypothetical protein
MYLSTYLAKTTVQTEFFIFQKQGQNLWPNRLMNGRVYKKKKSKIAYGSALPVLNHSNDVHLQEPKHLRQFYLRLEC